MTGQLHHAYNKNKDGRWFYSKVGINIITFFIMLFVTAVNIGSLVFDMYVIIWCPYINCGYISAPYINVTHLMDIQVAETHNNSNGSIVINAVQAPNLTIFDDWQKTVFTTATVSGTFSYLFMICVLNYQYSFLRWCRRVKKRCSTMLERCGEEPRQNDHDGVVRNPFNDNRHEENSTWLSPKQALYFVGIFTLNISVYVGNVALLFIIYNRNVDKSKKKQEIIDGLGLAAQVASQLCAVLSCFIFSKLAYSVSTTCTHKLPKLYMKVNEASKITMTRAPALQGRQGQAEIANVQGEETVPHNSTVNAADAGIIQLRDGGYITEDDIKEKSSLHLLKAIANWYTRLVHSTLHPFGTWFAVHWVLYTVTAFMSISYLAEIIILELYGKESADTHCHGEHHLDCRLNLSYSFLFAVEHCILFLYPCFRAASVTTAYLSMIKKVSKAEWGKISLDDKEKFISYLKLQDCTFKISILCAKLSFGFQVAYFSIFVGLFGIILKIAL